MFPTIKENFLIWRRKDSKLAKLDRGDNSTQILHCSQQTKVVTIADVIMNVSTSDGTISRSSYAAAKGPIPKPTFLTLHKFHKDILFTFLKGMFQECTCWPYSVATQGAT